MSVIWRKSFPARVLNIANTKPVINYKKAVFQNVMKSYFALMLQCISCCYVKSVIDPLHSHKQQDFFQLQALENPCVQFCLLLFLGLSHFANTKLSYI